MARIDQLRAHSAPKDNAPYVWAGLRGPGRTELDPDEMGTTAVLVPKSGDTPSHPPLFQRAPHQRSWLLSWVFSAV
jgi:hypothetical protein